MLKPNSRRQARSFVVQALYQWQCRPASATDVLQQFHEDNAVPPAIQDYFSTLVTEVIHNQTDIDAALTPHLNRKISTLNPVALAILRLAMVELIYHLDVPYRVVINEAVELAKSFGATDSYKFVNGVLQAAADKIRENEINQGENNEKK
ncbi:MAG: transcription antitermination factor NusB [Gammaproteobacteria bacterium]|nr:transcription antitermination factor NusB [Gammaproteobacteria bacterium]